MGIFVKGISYVGKVFTKLGGKCERTALKYGTKAAKGVETAAAKPTPKYTGPTLSEMVAKQPKALPAPTAEQLVASRPKLNTGKLFGYGSDQLNLSQVITKDGVHVRYYRKPGSNKIVLKTEDKGLSHKEWAYGDRAGDLTYLKTVGDDVYLVRKKDEVTEIARRTKKYKDGIEQTLTTETVVGDGMKRTLRTGFNGKVDDEVIVNYNERFWGKPKRAVIPVKDSEFYFRDSQAAEAYQTFWSNGGNKVVEQFHDFIKRPLGFLDDLLSPYKP